MSWTCPHQRQKKGADLYCERRAKPCEPMKHGCVLEGKFKLIGQGAAPSGKMDHKPTPGMSVKAKR